ncbi:hypothetical protein PLEOSDRAFT_154892 [Pleurotus ostreatus PC15]|nr:hypothetical protein PLEOSDRAFT_154892 [Pleurotus ostreatus PC15]
MNPSSYSSSFGKPCTRTGPIELRDDRRMEQESLVWISIIVIPPQRSRNSQFITAHDPHWCLSWDLSLQHVRAGKPSPQRRLHNAEDAIYSPRIECSKIDEAIQHAHSMQMVYPIKELSLKQRAHLENIAAATGSNGSCREWCLRVLRQAMLAGLFTEQEISQAKYMAEAAHV